MTQITTIATITTIMQNDNGNKKNSNIQTKNNDNNIAPKTEPSP